MDSPPRIMNTNRTRHLYLAAGVLLLILAGVVLLQSNTKMKGVLRTANSSPGDKEDINMAPYRRRGGGDLSEIPKQDNTPGMLDVPGVGQIAYASKKMLGLRDLLRLTPTGKAPNNNMVGTERNYVVTIYEDSNGNFLHLDHGRGRFPSHDRGDRPAEIMMEEGVSIKFAPIGLPRTNDPAFAEHLVEILDRFSSEGNAGNDRESSITAVICHLDRSYTGKAPKGIDIPALLIQDCTGSPPPPFLEFEPKNLPYEEAITRYWRIEKLRAETGVDTASSDLLWCATVYERRADGIRNELPDFGQGAPTPDPALKQE